MTSTQWCRSLPFVPALLLAGQAAIASPESADALFQEGRELMRQGSFAAACERFRESYREDTALGTLLNIAVCEERSGTLTRAYADLVAFRDACGADDPRRQKADVHLAELGARIPKLTLRLDGAERRSLAAHISVDGTRIAVHDLDKPLPLEPGQHLVKVTWPSGTNEYRVTLVEAEHAVQIISVPEAPSQPARLESPPPKATSHGSLPYVLGGVGAATLVAGIVTGALALDAKQTVANHCHADQCDAKGLAANRDGRAYATASTFTWIAGAVALGAGTVVYFSAGGAPPQPGVRAGASRLVGIKGEF